MAMLMRFWKKLDQRFPASQERAFKRTLQPYFTIPICVGSLTTILAFIQKYWTVLRLAANVRGDTRDDQVILYSWYKDICLVSLSALVTLILSLQSHIARWLCPVDLELLVLVQGCVALTLVSFGGKWYLAVLLGRNPYEVWGSGAGASESYLFGMISLVTVICCLVIPIRSCYSLLLPLYGICVFCILSFAISSPFPDSVPQLVFILCCVSAFAVFGGFHKERHMRKEWQNVQRLQETTAVIDHQDLTIQGQQLEILGLEEGANVAQSRMHELQSSIQIRFDEIKSMESKIRSLNNEIDELEVERRDHMMPLPGENPSVIPSTFRKKMRNGKTARCCKNLEGTWVLMDGNADSNLWLSRLEFQGGNVILGDGTHARLKTDSNGNFLLEGGVLSFYDHDIMYRTGKSGKMLRFKRCHTHPLMIERDDEVDEEDDEDRRSLASFDDSVSLTLSGRTGTIENLSEYLDTRPAAAAAEVPSRPGTSSSSTSTSASSTDQMVPTSPAAHVYGKGMVTNMPGQYEEDPLPHGWMAGSG